MSAHSENSTAANATSAPPNRLRSRRCSDGTSSLRQTAYAIERKLKDVMVATRSGGRLAIARPTITATPIFTINAATMPHITGTVAYRVASTPLVYRSLLPTSSAANTVTDLTNVATILGG